jgi:hypothetical protein
MAFRVRLTNKAKATVSDAFRLQLQVLVTVLGGYFKVRLTNRAIPISYPQPLAASPGHCPG